MTHVLIVDDDPALLQALPEALRLRLRDVVVDTCDSATAALFRIAATDYDAVVSDIKMPGKDGLALLAEIRALRPETPTLLITGHGEHDLAVQALRGGAFDFIQKPIDRDYFIASLSRAIRLRQLARQVEEQKLALERHAVELEQAVQDRTRELQDANQAKDRFLAVLSHELRTPLTPIQASVELLRQVAADPERVRRVADVIERNLRLQTSLVNDLLDLSRMTRGKLALECRPIALRQLVGDTLDGLQADAQAAGLTLVWHPPDTELYVDADSFRTQQILLNLVGNAIRFTSRGGRVTLTLAPVYDSEPAVVDGGFGGETRGGAVVSRVPEASAAVRLVVEDTGIGIAPEALPQIFSMFHQQQKRAPGESGLGIGLALVESLVRGQGGRVWAESDGLGRGSRFIVELPMVAGLPGSEVKSPGSDVAPSAPRPHTPDPSPQVLLVEDNPDSRETLAEVLELFGYRVHCAASAEAALSLLAACRPAVILTDIGLPGVSGYELIRQVRAMPDHAGVVALAVTGFGTADDRERALAAGFDDHLAKPLDPVALDRQLRRMLAVGRA